MFVRDAQLPFSLTHEGLFAAAPVRAVPAQPTKPPDQLGAGRLLWQRHEAVYSKDVQVEGFQKRHQSAFRSSSGEFTTTTFVELTRYAGFPCGSYSPSTRTTSVRTSLIRTRVPSSRRYSFQNSSLSVR